MVGGVRGVHIQSAPWGAGQEPTHTHVPVTTHPRLKVERTALVAPPKPQTVRTAAELLTRLVRLRKIQPHIQSSVCCK